MNRLRDTGRHGSLNQRPVVASRAKRAQFGTQATTNTDDVKDHTQLDVLNEARHAPAQCPFSILPAALRSDVFLTTDMRGSHAILHTVTDDVRLMGRRRLLWRIRVCVSTKTGSTREPRLTEASLALKAGLRVGRNRGACGIWAS